MAANRSPEIRKDSVHNRWVMFSPARARRPSDLKAKPGPNEGPSGECPFCAGHEEENEVFKNHGASAGASMSHSHSQIIALPVVPPAACARIQSMKEYFDHTGKCALCQVRQQDDLLIDQSAHFISVVPFAATFPFEIWIIPRHHSSHFHHLDNDKALDLAGLLKLMLQKISLQLNKPPYNLMIHSAPIQMESTQLPFSHWFIQIVPQLTVMGGFELGTGCFINPVFPEDAAKVLREVTVEN